MYWYKRMRPTLTLTKTLGIQYPIIQAPMACDATSPELVAAVSSLMIELIQGIYDNHISLV